MRSYLVFHPVKQTALAASSFAQEAHTDIVFSGPGTGVACRPVLVICRHCDELHIHYQECWTARNLPADRASLSSYYFVDIGIYSCTLYMSEREITLRGVAINSAVEDPVPF